LIAPVAASFLLCLLAMLALRPVAIAVKLIDRPGGRKIHNGEVPIVGGIAMLLGIVLGLGFVPLPEIAASPFLAASALLVTVGLLDDRFELSPWTRLGVHVAAAALLVGASGTSITVLASLADGTQITLEGFQSQAVTVLTIVAAINAFNMLDGMDGLAGATSIVALAALAFLALDVNAIIIAATALTVLGAVAAFLIANVPAKFNRDMRCFMGDSGSTLLGFAVAWLCLVVSQPPVQAASPITLLWVVALPLFDFVCTVIRRLLRGASLLEADDEHLHHLLLKAGFRVRGAFAIFVALSALLAAIGIAIDRFKVSDSVSLLLLMGTGILVVRLMYQAHGFRAWVPVSFKSASLIDGKDGRSTET
jgi:UDP-GlcNAc:undecaprenyl-phosphate GlcNAc-1-phosphate transferase